MVEGLRVVAGPEHFESAGGEVVAGCGKSSAQDFTYHN